MGSSGHCSLIIIPPSDHLVLTGEPCYPAARSNRSVTQRHPSSYRESLDKFLPVSSITPISMRKDVSRGRIALLVDFLGER